MRWTVHYKTDVVLPQAKTLENVNTVYVYKYDGVENKV